MSMYFIVGTDTDCGKTHVACEFITSLRKKQRRVLGVKLVASGCMNHNDHIISEDALCLAKACGVAYETPWRYVLPVSPHLAALACGKTIIMQELIDFCKPERFTSYDDVVIEGAGGLMVPLDHQNTWIDFLLGTKVPVILVVGMRLGCINHALLTMSVLEAHGIVCAGWIANMIDPHMLMQDENISTLCDKIKPPLLMRVQHQVI